MPRRKSAGYIRCKDGHYVKSKMEKAVDDFLYKYGIPHKVYPKIPHSDFVADFKVQHPRLGDIYIEVWGLEGRIDYDQRMREKKKHYKKYALHYIGIHKGENIQKKLSKILPPEKRRITDFDVFKRATEDERIRELDLEIEKLEKEIDKIQKRISELTHERNKIISENVNKIIAGKRSR